jgi:hypothetical protein
LHDAEIRLCHDVMPPRIAARRIVMSFINSRKYIIAVGALLILIPVSLGQSRRLSRQQASTEPSADQIVTELRHLQVGGISDELMISYVRSRGHAYQLTAEQVIRLKDGGVDDLVIKALMGDGAANPAPVPSPTVAADTFPDAFSVAGIPEEVRALGTVLRFPVDDCEQRLQLPIGRQDRIQVGTGAVGSTDSNPEANNG